MSENPLDDLLAQTKTLIDAITFDDLGAMVGGQWMGGNGGLISRQTIVETDKLRRLLTDFNAMLAGGDFRLTEFRQVELPPMVIEE